MSDIPVFQAMEPDIREGCVRYMEQIAMPPGFNVFNIDEEGDKFFLILKGSVGVKVRDIKVGATAQGNEELREVKTLNTGDFFGELALSTKKPRAATLTCLEDCFFATLDKKFYNLVFSRLNGGNSLLVV
jgi:CRP-like cAMP-binding protein